MTSQGNAFQLALSSIPNSVAPDIREDIVSDVCVGMLEAKDTPPDLMRLVKAFTEKNLSMYVNKADEVSISLLPTNDFGENKATRVDATNSIYLR
jgi:hypothetical protein